MKNNIARTYWILSQYPKKCAFFIMSAIGLILLTAVATVAAKNAPDLTLQVIKEGSSEKIALHRTIQVSVTGLDQWAKQKGNDPSKFVLCIDGNDLKGLVPVLVHNGSQLQYDLKRTPGSENVWDAILSRKTRGFTSEREVPVTVKHDDVDVEGEYSANLVIVNKTWFYAFAVVFAAAIIIFVCMARKSDILRGSGEQPKGIDHRGLPNRKRYSLARTQMAFWFFAIIISYVFIWMVTDDISCITTSVLGLMGISAATGLGSAAVDSSKIGEQQNLKRSIEEKKKNSEAEAESLQTQSDTLNKAVTETLVADVHERKLALAGSLAVVKKEIEQSDHKIRQLVDAAKPAVSKGFFIDILSDNDGLSFHRFQMFAWTIVLIIVFLSSVYRVLTMPEFDGTLLALMGISSGTYIGFKLPLQQG
jgi:hypothetical protein